jgi:hypothetical protein
MGLPLTVRLLITALQLNLLGLSGRVGAVRMLLKGGRHSHARTTCMYVVHGSKRRNLMMWDHFRFVWLQVGIRYYLRWIDRSLISHKRIRKMELAVVVGSLARELASLWSMVDAMSQTKKKKSTAPEGAEDMLPNDRWLERESKKGIDKKRNRNQRKCVTSCLTIRRLGCLRFHWHGPFELSM